MEKNVYYNQKIDCDVLDCKHCNEITGECTLSNIKIHFQKKNTKKEKETFCESFEVND